MKPTNVLHSDDSLGWRCDSCHRRITRVDDGWVEWLTAEDKRGGNTVTGLRLVHRTAYRSGQELPCRYDPRKVFGKRKRVVEGVALDSVVGPDGLMLLLSFLASGEFPKAEILELAKRVQVPGYETTRILFQEASVPELITPFLGKGYYLQSEISQLLFLASETPKRLQSRTHPQGQKNAVA